ncbi:MAG: hypothetical protein J6D43_01430, partial [Pseudomonas sp.]|nr:hypothetical protein [Pseudomonas sp.]
DISAYTAGYKITIVDKCAATQGIQRSLSFLSPTSVLCGLGYFTYLSGKTIGELPALMRFSAV